MPKLTRDKDGLHISLSGAQDFPLALAQVKSISGRKFDPDTKLWSFPDEPGIAERLMFTVKPDADAALVQWVRNSRAEREAQLTTDIPDDDPNILVPWSERLYDFQRSAVGFIAANRRVILADDMGLGKTVQCLAAVQEYILRNPEVDAGRPRLVICPNSVKGVWKREIAKWMAKGEPVTVVDAKTPKKRTEQIKDGLECGAWIIVNWEQIRAEKVETESTVKHRDGSTSERTEVTWRLKQTLFEGVDWLAVVADEAHRAKSRKSLQTRGLWMLDAPVKIAATGTPLQNAPDELWAILRWLYPEQYGNSTPGHPRTAFWPFHDQYTDSYEVARAKGTSRVIVGVKNPDALRFELKGRLIRRTKAQKLNLPDKTREYVPLTMGPAQAKVYAEAESEFWLKIEQAIKEGDKQAADFAADAVAGKKRIFEIQNGAARTVRLRQVCCSPAILGGKDDSVKLDAIQEAILDNSHQQHVVFTEFVEGANLLVARLKAKGVEAEAFTGEVKDTQIRTYYEERFQNGHIDVLVGTLGAMREGITLTASNVEHFCERAWVPGWNEQAEDREHRVGQKNPVTIYIYEVEGTVDTDKVRPTNQLKEMIVSSVIVKDKIKEAA